MQMSGVLQSIDDRGVAVMTLNNPDRHNAFDQDIG
jgi:enoyl-CoA hydratase/carnithine racemase